MRSTRVDITAAMLAGSGGMLKPLVAFVGAVAALVVAADDDDDEPITTV